MVNILLSVAENDSNQLVAFIRELCAAQKCPCKLASEASVDKIERYLAKHPNVFEIFVIDGNNERILSLCKVIRKANQTAKIIMLKDIEKAALNHYLIFRPSAIFPVVDFNKDFQRVFITCVRQCKGGTASFTLKTRDLSLRIPHENILYFSSDKRIVSVFLNNGKAYGFYGKLSEILQTLPQNRFIQCHQSFIVNIDKVIALNKTEKCFLVEGNKQVDISKAKYNETAKFFEDLTAVNS